MHLDQIGIDTAELIVRLDHDFTRFVAGDMGEDPVLGVLVDLAGIRDEVNRHLRAVLAYGRSVRPRPYLLADLASATGMSVSGVRTAYSRQDLDLVLSALNRHTASGVRPRAGDPITTPTTV